MRIQINARMRSELIDKCCYGLTAYVNKLAVYELSEKSRRLLAEVLQESLWDWVSHDERLFEEIKTFYSAEVNLLERHEFYERLYTELVRRPEFIKIMSQKCDTGLLRKRA